jgi:hypothetical protein
VELLDERRSKPAPAEAPASAEGELDADPAFLCGRCETPVARRASLFAMRASSYVQVFPNPMGQMKVIYTLGDATVRIVGPPATEYTWFAGYGWSVAYCPACGAHLGWRFDAVLPSEPAAFYGLLKASLTES